MTMRLSHSSLTGTDRTLVAVGTVRLASMFWTVRAGAPLRTVCFGSSVAFASAFFSGSLGVGWSLLVAALLVALLSLLLLFLLSDCTLFDFSAFFSVLPSGSEELFDPFFDPFFDPACDFACDRGCDFSGPGRLFGAPVDS